MENVNLHKDDQEVTTLSQTREKLRGGDDMVKSMSPSLTCNQTHEDTSISDYGEGKIVPFCRAI